MLKLEFLENKRYTPNMLCVPNEWSNISLDNIDFTKKENLRNFLVDFLKDFKHDNADSIIFYANDFAFQLFVALYREIGSRITVDNYKFFNWIEYIAKLKGAGSRAEQLMIDDLFAMNFIFIFDLTLSLKEEWHYFFRLLDYSYTNKIKLFIATHMDILKILEMVEDEKFANIFQDKIIRIKIKE